MNQHTLTNKSLIASVIKLIQMGEAGSLFLVSFRTRIDGYRKLLGTRKVWHTQQ